MNATEGTDSFWFRVFDCHDFLQPGIVCWVAVRCSSGEFSSIIFSLVFQKATILAFIRASSGRAELSLCFGSFLPWMMKREKWKRVEDRVTWEKVRWHLLRLSTSCFAVSPSGHLVALVTVSSFTRTLAHAHHSNAHLKISCRYEPKI